jgi:hypothetical protein
MPIVVSPEFRNTRPSIDVLDPIRTVVEPVTVDWLKTAVSPVVGADVGAVPPEVGLSDQFPSVAQVPVVVVSQYQVAARAGAAMPIMTRAAASPGSQQARRAAAALT